MTSKKDFIKGVLATLNKLHWKVIISRSEGYTTFSGYACDILMHKKIPGTIYFNSKKQKYIYVKKPKP